MSQFKLRLEDLDDEKNLLLMSTELESKFDRSGFCFLPNPGKGTFIMLEWNEKDESAAPFRESLKVSAENAGEDEASGKFRPCKRELQTKSFVIPDFVSRKHLMIHAMDFHRKHKLKLDPTLWLELPPRNSTEEKARLLIGSINSRRSSGSPNSASSMPEGMVPDEFESLPH